MLPIATFWHVHHASHHSSWSRLSPVENLPGNYEVFKVTTAYMTNNVQDNMNNMLCVTFTQFQI